MSSRVVPVASSPIFSLPPTTRSPRWYCQPWLLSSWNFHTRLLPSRDGIVCVDNRRNGSSCFHQQLSVWWPLSSVYKYFSHMIPWSSWIKIYHHHRWRSPDICKITSLKVWEALPILFVQRQRQKMMVASLWTLLFGSKGWVNYVYVEHEKEFFRIHFKPWIYALVALHVAKIGAISKANQFDLCICTLRCTV